jgi:ribosomal protein L29
MFEYALRHKFRFQFKGVITVEDLWDLSIEDLDTLYKSLRKQLKNSEEESLLAKKNPDDEILSRKIDIVKYIFETKQAEANMKLLEKARKEQRQKIMSIMAAKQDEELQGKSLEDLQKMLDSLNA